MSRKSCFACVRKHIAQASVLMDESKLGYPFYRWYAIGHLAEAESEARGENQAFAEEIRKTRLDLMDKNIEPAFDMLLIHACKIAGDLPDLQFNEENSKKYKEELND